MFETKYFFFQLLNRVLLTAPRVAAVQGERRPPPLRHLQPRPPLLHQPSGAGLWAGGEGLEGGRQQRRLPSPRSSLCQV